MSERELRLAAETDQGLRVRSLGKVYGSRPVIRDISLDVNRAEVVALLGLNGAGKTTCFYSIAGLVIPTTGRIILDGRDITYMPMYRRAQYGIGYLPQEASVFRGLNVENNIMAILEIAERDATKRSEQLETLLTDFSIEHLRRASVVQLSGGERRRVEIARSLAASPKFLLLDEPFAGIDPIAVEDIRGLIRELSTKGIGILITDHNVRETLDIVDRAYIIHEGHILKTGSKDEIIHDPEVRRIYLGNTFKVV